MNGQSLRSQPAIAVFIMRALGAFAVQMSVDLDR